MWYVKAQNDKQLIYQQGRWRFRIALLLLPFILLTIALVVVKEDPLVNEFDGILKYMILFFSLCACGFFWGCLFFTANKTTTFISNPASVRIDRRWGVFTTSRLIKLNPSDKILGRKERHFFWSNMNYKIYLVVRKKKIHVLSLKPGLYLENSMINRILNFTGLEYDSRSNIVDGMYEF
ncbi:MAG: hypothetical protein IT287_03460 [Bdellovibrionaceae bacterium]|nr:hypothetical protein [Pseudobdellovibrionaceae bacterium]